LVLAGECKPTAGRRVFLMIVRHSSFASFFASRCCRDAVASTTKIPETVLFTQTRRTGCVLCRFEFAVHMHGTFTNLNVKADNQLRSMMTTTTQKESDETLRAEILRYGDMPPHPVSLGDVLDCQESHRVAKFLHTEFPIRCAERILMIETIPDWKNVAELADAHARHVKAFDDMLHVQRTSSLDEFTALAKSIVHGNKDIVPLMAKAMHQLSQQDPEKFDAEFVDTFLNDFLLNRLGSNILMSQYLACSDCTDTCSSKTNGIIDPSCNVAEHCSETASRWSRSVGSTQA